MNLYISKYFLQNRYKINISIRLFIDSLFPPYTISSYNHNEYNDYYKYYINNIFNNYNIIVSSFNIIEKISIVFEDDIFICY